MGRYLLYNLSDMKSEIIIGKDASNPMTSNESLSLGSAIVYSFATIPINSLIIVPKRPD